VAGDLRHFDQVGNLAVGAVRGAVDDEMKIKPGISLNQRIDDRDCAVGGILDAEDELSLARIILMEIGLEILGEMHLGAI
jgi:hypothetical protein